MNIKKIILTHTTIIGLVASSCVLANGFYTGIGAGASSFNNTIATSDNQESYDFGSIGVIGSLFAGYNFSLAHKLNLGLEAFGNTMSASVTADHVNNNVTINDNTLGIATNSELKISSRYAYGLRILPGYEITSDTICHIILGYVRGNFKLTDNGRYGIASSVFNSNGLQTGIGLSTHITKNIILGVDAIYTTYTSQMVSGTTTTGAPLTYKNKPYTLDGLISLQYKFG